MRNIKAVIAISICSTIIFNGYHNGFREWQIAKYITRRKVWPQALATNNAKPADKPHSKHADKARLDPASTMQFRLMAVKK
jgi:hypothetical protein